MTFLVLTASEPSPLTWHLQPRSKHLRNALMKGLAILLACGDAVLTSMVKHIVAPTSVYQALEKSSYFPLNKFSLLKNGTVMLSFVMMGMIAKLMN